MNHLLAYFQKIYVINLPARGDRRQEMEAQLQSIGLGLGHPLVHLFAAIRPDDPGGFPSPGARGCFLSHLEVLRSARTRQLKRFLILEDDVNFVPDFQERLPIVVGSLATSPWSLFYGGHVLDDTPGMPGPDGLLALAADTPLQTSHFLALNGPRTLIDCIDTLEALLRRPPGDPAGGPMHVDGAYHWFRKEHPHLVTLLAMPPLGYQRRSRTDVHDLKWFDRLPVARQASAWLRQWRNP